jgi:hypothetical protein
LICLTGTLALYKGSLALLLAVAAVVLAEAAGCCLAPDAGGSITFCCASCVDMSSGMAVTSEAPTALERMLHKQEQHWRLLKV